MKTLVTGGAGFIGSNLVDALLARGDEVTMSTTSRPGAAATSTGRSRPAPSWSSSTSATPPRWPRWPPSAPEAVFHLAAQIDVRKSVADPAFDAAINVGGTANVLEAAAPPARGRVVFVSTGGAIYGEGEGQQLPLDEDAPIAPMSAYGQSKFAAEGYLALYERLYGLSSVRLRLGNVYGPRQDPLGEAGVIAIFCGLLRVRRPADRLRRRQADPRLHICGRRGRGGAGRRPSPTASGPINLGTGDRDRRARAGRGRSAELGGAEDFEPEFAPPRAGEVQRITLDAGRAERELGWRAADRPRRGPAADARRRLTPRR